MIPKLMGVCHHENREDKYKHVLTISWEEQRNSGGDANHHASVSYRRTERGAACLPCMHTLHKTLLQPFQRCELGRWPQPFLRTLRVAHSKDNSSCIWALPFPKRVIFPPAQPLQQAPQQMPAPEGQGWEGTLSCRCSNGSQLLSGDPGRPWQGLQLQEEPHPGPVLLPDTANTAQPVTKRFYLLS